MQNRKIWFKRKRYGWGWYPSSWEGWAILLGWIVLFLIGEFAFIHQMSLHQSRLIIAVYFLFIGCITSVLIAVSFRRGERPRWQWGDKKSDKK